jgi:glycosyltransferase involved in cell wall biosynthesis
MPPILETIEGRLLWSKFRTIFKPAMCKILFVNLYDLRRIERSNWPSFLLAVDSNCTSDSIDLTVIIPSFNAANFISETLIRVREIPNVQILVLDDGSNDQTVEISSSLLQGHSNYAVLTLKHKGSPGRSRNFGASLAAGKWIWFLDCDDMPLLGNLTDMLQVADELSAEMIILRYLIRNDYEKMWEMGFDHNIFSKLTKSNYQIFRDWNSAPSLVRLSPHPSRIIYSRKFVVENSLIYDVEENFEDGSFWPRALLKAQNIMTWNWPQLVYRVRLNSITYSQELERKLFLLSQFRKIFSDDELRRRSNQNLWGSTYLYALEMISWPLNSLESSLRREYARAARKTIKETGTNWFGVNSCLTMKDRFFICRSLLRMQCYRFTISCLLRGIV